MKLTKKQLRQLLILLLLLAVIAWRIWGPDTAAPAPADPDSFGAPQSVSSESLPADTESAAADSDPEPESDPDPPADDGKQETLADSSEAAENTPAAEESAIDEDGSYTSKEDVALYLYTYGRLPANFITKDEARDLGWEGGSLEPYAPGCCIGGDKFGNYEGLLPEKKGRRYTECDIDTLGRSKRGAKRIVFSNDGLIYYTDDHYESFELLYGEE